MLGVCICVRDELIFLSLLAVFLLSLLPFSYIIVAVAGNDSMLLFTTTILIIIML